MVDSVADYVAYMKEIFDFNAIKGLLHGADGNPPLKVLINAMHGGKGQQQEQMTEIILKFFDSF